MEKGGLGQGSDLRRRLRRSTRSRRRSSRGVALVEFAVVAPALFYLVFGAIDLGRVYAFENRLKNMSRAGAAWAQFNPGQFDTNGADNCTNPYNLVYQTLNEPNPPGSLASYTVVLTDGTTTYTAAGSDTSQCASTIAFPSGDQVTIKVSGTFTFVTPLAGIFTGSQSIRVTASHTVVVQG
jgi:Flp pilus assembly protein TadG